MLSASNSFMATNWPEWILEASLAVMGGRTDNNTTGLLFSVSDDMLLGRGGAPAAVINAGSEAQESAIDAGGDDSRVGSRTGRSTMDDAGWRDPRLPAVKSKGRLRYSTVVCIIVCNAVPVSASCID